MPLASYTQGVVQGLGVLAQAFPRARWLGTVASIATPLAMGADMFVSRRLRGPDPIHQVDEQLAILRSHIAAPRPEPRAQTTETPVFLMEHGQDPDEDCFSCATGHFAAARAHLAMARRHMDEEGGCGPKCQRRLEAAAEEFSALFARDWTPGRRFRGTPAQQAAQNEVVERFAPRVRDIQAAILSGPDLDDRAALVEAAANLREAVRFAEDRPDHPAAEARRLDAEAHLAGAERFRPGWAGADLSQNIRRLRQDVGSRLGSRDAYLDAQRRSADLALAANAPVFASKTPEEIDAALSRLDDLRSDFSAERRRLATVADMGHLGAPGAGDQAHRPRREDVERYTAPAQEMVQAVAEPEKVSDYLRNLLSEVEARGTKVRVRSLPTTFEQTLFGAYDTETDTMLLDTFVPVAQDPFAFQVAAHETTHALLDGPRCYHQGYVPGVPYDRQPAEVRAQVASLAAQIDLGIPIELADGSELPPGERQVDWDKVRQLIGDDGVRDAQWASRWIVRAARGEDGNLLTEPCPAKGTSAIAP